MEYWLAGKSRLLLRHLQRQMGHRLLSEEPACQGWLVPLAHDEFHPESVHAYLVLFHNKVARRQPSHVLIIQHLPDGHIKSHLLAECTLVHESSIVLGHQD